MKRVKKTWIALWCIFCMTVLLSLTAAAGQKASVKLSKTTLSITAGDSAALKATVTGKNSKVTWKSGNTSIATVSSTGKIKAKKAGKTTITAKANGKTAKCTVTVKKATGYVKAYKKLLANEKLEWAEISFYVNTAECTFALAYIDDDSVPELIIFNNFQTPHMGGYGAVYTFRKNKVKFVSVLAMDQPSSFCYYKKKGILVDNYTGQGITMESYERLKNGKLDSKVNKRTVYEYSYGNSEKYEYYAGSEKITKSAFDAKLKKLVGSTKKTTLKLRRNTAANRKKYIK